MGKLGQGELIKAGFLPILFALSPSLRVSILVVVVNFKRLDFVQFLSF